MNSGEKGANRSKFDPLTEWALSSAIANKLVKWLQLGYLYVFGRPAMQPINNLLLNLALHGRGYNNYWNSHLTGEDAFLRILAKHNPRFCIDVGANKGVYSEKILRLTDARVLAFEPLPVCFDELALLQNKYLLRFLPFNKGVGNVNTTLRLRYGTGNTELASFCKEVDEIDYVRNENISSIEVDVVTLDSFLPAIEGFSYDQIDLLKIDTEGYEFEVLLGASDIIATKRPKFIQIELNWHHLFKELTLFRFASMLPEYVPYQLLPYGSGLQKVDPRRPESNIFHFSNFVFVRNDIDI